MVSKYTINEFGYVCFDGKIVVPQVAIDRVLEAYHDSGHYNAEKVRKSISSGGYWFPSMDKMIGSYISRCLSCLDKSGNG